MSFEITVVVQIFPWFKSFQTSLIFTFLCLKSITIIRDKEKQKLNWFEKFKTKEKFKPQHHYYAKTCHHIIIMQHVLSVALFIQYHIVRLHYKM